MATKEGCLLRGAKLDRIVGVDSGDRDPHWSDLAILFNGAEKLDINHNRCPRIGVFDQFAFNHNILVGTSKSLRKKHNEFRGSMECGLVGHRRSGDI